MRTLLTLASLIAVALAPFLVPAAALPVAHAPARPAASARDEPAVQVEPVAGGVYVLYGRGGNVAVSAGADGVLMVDSQYPDMVPALLEAVRELGDGPPDLLVNTHWHGDHTGGNGGLAGAGALVVAHDNVYARMSTDQHMEAFDVPAAPRAAQPKLSYDESLTLHWNDDTLRVLHAPNAHTDGDSVVVWERANVVHMGDTFFGGMYPFIDADSGGHIDGLVANADRVLAMIDDEARLIPGHGPVAGKADLRAWRDMLASMSARLKELVGQGLSDAEIVAAKPTAEYDDAFGGGYFAPDEWVGIVLACLRRDGD